MPVCVRPDRKPEARCYPVAAQTVYKIWLGPPQKYVCPSNMVNDLCVQHSPKFSSILQSFPELRDSGNFFKVAKALKNISAHTELENYCSPLNLDNLTVNFSICTVHIQSAYAVQSMEVC